MDGHQVYVPGKPGRKPKLTPAELLDLTRLWNRADTNRRALARSVGMSSTGAMRAVKRFLAAHPNFLTLINENAPATNEGEHATNPEDGQHNQSNPTSTDAEVIGTQEAA